MSRPEPQWVEEALEDAGTTRIEEVLAAEVRALRHDLEYERTLRNGLERMLKDLGTQLTAADEVLP